MLKDLYTYTGKDPPEPEKIEIDKNHYAIIDGIDLFIAALEANTTAFNSAHAEQSIALERIRLASLGMVQ